MMKRFVYLIMILSMISIVYAQPFNTTNLAASENIYEQATSLNSLLGGLLGLGFLLSSVIITFVITTINTGDALSGLISGSFLGTVLGMLLLVLKFIFWWHYQIVLIILGISLGVKILLNSSN